MSPFRRYQINSLPNSRVFSECKLPISSLWACFKYLHSSANFYSHVTPRIRLWDMEVLENGRHHRKIFGIWSVCPYFSTISGSTHIFLHPWIIMYKVYRNPFVRWFTSMNLPHSHLNSVVTMEWTSPVFLLLAQGWPWHKQPWNNWDYDQEKYSWWGIHIKQPWAPFIACLIRFHCPLPGFKGSEIVVDFLRVSG